MALDPSSALATLGFSGLESEVYAFLLRESPATGYRIAQAIGKQAANVYKAIQTLEAKGAVTVESGGSRQCRPIPVDDLLERLARDFEDRRAAAQNSLSSLGAKSEPEAVHSLATRALVLQQAKALVAGATKMLAVSVRGPLWDDLAPDLQAALGRGVTVHLSSDHDLPGIPSIGNAAEWPGQHLILAVDGSSCLLAMIDTWGNVVQAVWSRGAFLSLVLHEGIVSAAAVSDLRERIEEGAGAKRLARALASIEPASVTPGFKSLQEELL